MAKHTLSLETPDTLNSKILRVIDTSIYMTSSNIECPILEITVPGFKQSVQFGDTKIAPGFMLNLTACDLELQTEDCGTTFKGLPDGIYVIKYSIAPNDTVFVEYNHLRITKMLNKSQQILCELDVAGCEPTKEVQSKLDQLSKIRQMLEAAKVKVEICHEPKKGMELYTYAKKLLGKFECTSCH